MTKKSSMRLEIIPELEDFIVPLQPEEYTQLELNIQSEGCREALIFWKHGRKNILIDGHNRYKICNKHNILFKLIEKKFNSIDEVKSWIIENQIGRRNLNPDQLSYYRGLQYERLKKSRGGYNRILSRGQNAPRTSEKLAKAFRVNERTIKRDSKFALGLEYIGRLNPSLKRRILNGEVSVKKSNINLLANSNCQTKVKSLINETDLDNKIKKLRLDLIQTAEKKLHSNVIEKDKKNTGGSIKEPLFPDEAYRLKKLKGEILSCLNRAIKNKDIKALEEI